MEPKSLRWACHPADQARIKELPGIAAHPYPDIPSEGDRIIHPFLVDPQTNQPCWLLVTQVLKDYSPDYWVIRVTRAQ